ncbi:MAG: alpha/beta fold hydrolase, partial [Pseudomonadota bacterium]
MEKLRTDESRFAGLPDYDFAPNYAEVEDGLRLHYVNEGPCNGRPVLMMHGEPSWSYLYRHMIPLVAKAGHRVIAPDLIGFGKSDKPTETSDYTYSRHVDWMMEWFDELDLNGVILFCQLGWVDVGTKSIAGNTAIFGPNLGGFGCRRADIAVDGKTG